MEFSAVILLLTLYYVRPQDWVPGLEGLNVIKPIMLLGLLGMLSRDRRHASSTAPWRLMATPHEWVVLVYAVYILATSPDFKAAAADLVPKVAAFLLTLHSLTSEQRQHSFMKWWRWSLVAVTAMGIGTVIGVDFTGSQAATDQNQGRLALHHWMLDNANAFGHTLITLLPLLYFGVVKGRPILRGLAAALPPAAMACVCLWSTQSKGAYLVGAGLLVFCVLLGRPWWLKISILALAMGMGGTALSFLPRMNEMSSLRADEGVVGRLMVWEMARNVTRTNATGEGYRTFNASILWEGRLVPKATHSAYVQVGGDLGLPGLLLYLSALCCALRSMLIYHGISREMDRLRGALFALLVGYAASGWMINRSYHLEFFVIMGAIAAYQNLCRRLVAEPVPATIVRASHRSPGQAHWTRRWHRYGLLDLGFAFVALQAVLEVWDYVLTSL